MIGEYFYFFKNQESDSESKVIKNLNGQELVLQVSAPNERYKLTILGALDPDSDYYCVLQGASSSYEFVQEITKNGIYIFNISGISKIKAVLTEVDNDEINVFGKIFNETKQRMLPQKMSSGGGSGGSKVEALISTNDQGDEYLIGVAIDGNKSYVGNYIELKDNIGEIPIIRILVDGADSYAIANPILNDKNEVSGISLGEEEFSIATPEATPPIVVLDIDETSSEYKFSSKEEFDTFCNNYVAGNIFARIRTNYTAGSLKKSHTYEVVKSQDMRYTMTNTFYVSIIATSENELLLKSITLTY